MKKILISILVLLLLCSTVYARKIHSTATDKLGDFSGDGGSAQDDSSKASLDLVHTDLDLLIRNATSGLLGLGNGNVWYVDSGAGGTAAATSWTNAALTIDAAIVLLGAATEADTGAIILCAPGHGETLTATDQVDLDFAGIKLISLGTGENRATMTYTTDGEIVFGADDCELHNFNLIAGNGVTNAVLVATNCENWIINNCRFAVTTLDTDEFTFGIITAAHADNGKVTNCRFEMGAASADAAIQNVGCDFVEISNNIFTGDYSTACIEDVTTASIWMIIDDNILVQGDSAGALNAVAAISLKSTTSAVITDNKIFCDMTRAGSVVAALGYLSGNSYNGTAGSGTFLEPGKTYVRTFIMPGATDDNLFLVAGGNILITSLTGYVTTDIGATCTISIIMDHADQDFEFTTAVDIDTAVDGGLITFTAAAPSVPTVIAIGADSGAGSPMVPWHCPPGMIELLDSNAGTTGVIEWSMVFIPLDEGVTVTAQ